MTKPYAYDCTADDGGRFLVRAEKDTTPNGWKSAIPLYTATEWQPMSTAPTDGTHCILAVRSGPFIFATQGAYLSGEWCAAFIDGPVQPLAWMPNVRLPEWALPWKQEEVV